jgi:hypothetical protein
MDAGHPAVAQPPRLTFIVTTRPAGGVPSSPMTEQGFHFCPRCGTALVAGLPYCPKCGFNIADIGGKREPAEASEQARDAVERKRDVVPFERGLRGPPIILVAVVIAVALAAFLLLIRPQGAGGPPPGSPGLPGPGGIDGASTSPVGPSAPIVGLTIQSPPDGQVVATKEVTVIGLAPPGLTVTRDISFGLDQHATADDTGHWAINVGLQEGQNDLVFRIGDDRSTEKRLRVTFTPPAAQ